MSTPVTDIVDYENTKKPETIGDRINQNHEEAGRILKEYKALSLQDGATPEQLDKGEELLAQSGKLLTENKLLGEQGKNATEITPEMEIKVSEQVAKAPAMDAQAQQIEIGKHTFLLFMQDITGLDLSDNDSKASVFDIFKAIMHISQPGAMNKVMAKMTDAANKINENPNATGKDKLDAVTDAANEAIDEIKAEAPKEQATTSPKTNDLGGVNGGAATYEVTKSPDAKIEGSDIKSTIREGGSPLITSSYNSSANPDPIAVSSVDATIDPDLVATDTKTLDTTQPAANNDQYLNTAQI